VGSFFSCYHNYNNGRFFYLAAINTVGGGIYLRLDHKHLHNNFFVLLLSFHNP